METSQELHGMEITRPPYAEEENKIVMYRKARDLARVMNEFFISKVEAIIKGLKKSPVTFLDVNVNS